MRSPVLPAFLPAIPALPDGVTVLRSRGNLSPTFTAGDVSRIGCMCYMTTVRKLDLLFRQKNPDVFRPIEGPRRITCKGLKEFFLIRGTPADVAERAIPKNISIVAYGREEVLAQPLRRAMRGCLDAVSVLLTQEASVAATLIEEQRPQLFLAHTDMPSASVAKLRKQARSGQANYCEGTTQQLLNRLHKDVLMRDDLLEDGESIPPYLLRRTPKR